MKAHLTDSSGNEHEIEFGVFKEENGGVALYEEDAQFESDQVGYVPFEKLDYISEE